MAITELVERIEEIGLQVEELLEQPHVDLSPERSADLEGWPTAGEILAAYHRIAALT